MKNFNPRYLYLFALVTLISLSCKSKSVYKTGDVVIMNKDTFDVIVDSHRIIEIHKLHPRNVLEEGSPMYLVRTHLDSTYTSQNPGKIGDIQVYQIFTKRK